MPGTTTSRNSSLFFTIAGKYITVSDTFFVSFFVKNPDTESEYSTNSYP